jgi:hypothetical protein
MARVRPAFPHFPCCFTDWDNTARRGRHAIVMVDSTPERFREQLALMARGVFHKDREERVIFINAWNEWAEGMYLEPDRSFGHGYLHAVASVLEDIDPRGGGADATGRSLLEPGGSRHSKPSSRPAVPRPSVAQRRAPGDPAVR